MKIRVWWVSAIVFGALGLAVASVPAQAKNKTKKECETEWKAAEAANNTGGKKHADFVTACRQETAAAPAAAPAEPTPAPKPMAKKPAEAPTAPSDAVFPTAVSPKYSKEKPGEARMHTCLDQYRTNKTNNANGGLKWIQKGGGYYSECNKRLKGAA